MICLWIVFLIQLDTIWAGFDVGVSQRGGAANKETYMYMNNTTGIRDEPFHKVMNKIGFWFCGGNYGMNVGE